MNPTVLWGLFIAYSLGIVILSFATTGKEKDSNEFWSGNREIPWWKLAISLTSGWLMLGWIGFGMGQIYMLGATGLWILPIPWFVLVVLILLNARQNLRQFRYAGVLEQLIKDENSIR